MPAYNSQYTGLQVDAALAAVYTAMGNNGIVDNDALTTTLGSYLLSTTAASTYLTKTDAVNIYQPIIITGTTGQFYRGDKSWSNTIVGDVVVNGNLSVGKTGNSNYITFYGITGDNPVQWAQHDYIGNRLWGSSESSELVLFKGNDVGNGSSTTTVSGSGPDRIRHIAAAHLFQTYSSALSGTFEAVCTSSVLTNIFEINTNNLIGYKRMILQENNTWLSPARLQLLRPDTTAYTDRACIGATDGNLHIDPYPNKGLYLNFYNSGGNVYFNGATYYINGGHYNGNAATATAVSTCSANGDNVAAMKSVWDSLPTNKTLGVYIAHGSASFFYGWRLAGYAVGTAYGGGIIDNYGSPQYLNVSSGTFTLNYISQTSGSSKYIKTNISPMTFDEAKKLLNINCVKYDYIDGYGGNDNYGAIAEDMEKIIPYAVHKAANYDANNPNTRMNIYIDYQRLVPYLIKMVQIQEEEIKMLQLRITNLERGGR